MNKSTKKKTAPVVQLEEAIRLFERANVAIGLVPRLTPQERKRSVKAPRGAYGLVPLLAALTTKYGLATSKMNGDVLAASFARLETLESLLVAADEAVIKAYDAQTVASCEVWSAFRMFYGMLTALGAANPELASDLKPIVEWFGNRKAPGRAPSEPAAAPSE
jgi:hypothetical protein